jgi:hypothetical protein
MELVRHGKLNTLSLWTDSISSCVCRVHVDLLVQLLLVDSIHFPLWKETFLSFAIFLSAFVYRMINTVFYTPTFRHSVPYFFKTTVLLNIRDIYFMGNANYFVSSSSSFSLLYHCRWLTSGRQPRENNCDNGIQGRCCNTVICCNCFNNGFVHIVATVGCSISVHIVAIMCSNSDLGSWGLPSS